MTDILNYDFKILLNPENVPVFEDMLSEVAAAVLTVMIEKGSIKANGNCKLFLKESQMKTLFKQ